MTENNNKIQSYRLDTIKTLFMKNWPIILIGIVFSITRLPFITYPLGLLWRQVVKEGYRTYETITIGTKINFSIYFEQPIYRFILEMGYILSGRSPDGLVLWGRSMGFIFSAITLILIYKISRMTFGEIAALFSSFLYAISPYGILVGIGIMRETLMWLFGLCSIFFFLKYVQTNNEKFIILNLIFSIITMMTKFTGIYFLFTSLIAVILFYSGSPKGIKITFQKRMVLLFSFCGIMAIFASLLVLSSIDETTISPLNHTVISQPEALWDPDFYKEFMADTIQFIPSTTAFLGGIGFFLTLFKPTKERLVLIIWTLFTGLEFVFYGYGTVIHEYYVLYFLHPLAILAGNTLLLLYQSSLTQVPDQNRIPAKLIEPALLILLIICSGFFPFYHYHNEIKKVQGGEVIYQDIRSVGLFLNNYDIEGEDIAIIFWTEDYEWWKHRLTLVRTYIAKSDIKVIYASNISDVINSSNYKAILGWTEDFLFARDTITSIYKSYIIYNQTPNIPSMELWY